MRRVHRTEPKFENLTRAQIEVLDLMLECFSQQVVALSRNVSFKTISTQICVACEFMGFQNNLELLVKYDRWKREQEEAYEKSIASTSS